MTAIQLVFENGITSPLFDGNHSRATGMTTVQIPDKPIKRISVRTGGVCAYSLQFEFAQGPPLVVFDKGYTGHPVKSQEIPANHHIVGVYGRIQSNLILYLSFILAEF